jgi:hypothetical protein
VYNITAGVTKNMANELKSGDLFAETAKNHVHPVSALPSVVIIDFKIWVAMLQGFTQSD